MRVFVDTDRLRQIQTKLEDTVADILSSEMSNISNLVNSTDYWQGSDQVFYCERMNGYIDSFNEFQKSVASYSGFLVLYTKAVEQLDEEYSNKQIDLV